MNLTNLRYFVEVAELGSISGVAQRRYTSQQAVSEQIRRLESHYGCRLLERTRPLTLTPSGELVLATAKEIFSTLDRLSHQLQAQNKKENSVTVCAAMAYTSPLLLQAVECFHRRMPEAELTLLQPSSTEERLTAPLPQADILMGDLPFDDGIEAVVLVDEPYGLAVSEALLQSVYGANWISVDAELRRTGSLQAVLADLPLQLTWVEEQRFRMRVTCGAKIHSSSTDMVVLLCKSGQSATIFPLNFARKLFEHESQILIYELGGAYPHHITGMGYRRETSLSHAGEVFLLAAREASAALEYSTTPGTQQET